MPSPSEASASRPGIPNPDAERCAICLMPIIDRTRGACQHEFCFKCIGVWANQSRRCPLCNMDMGEHFTHDLSNNPPTKFFLPPLPEGSSVRRRVLRKSASPPPPVDPATAEAAEVALERRRQVYAHGVYAKHTASNEHTGYARTMTPVDMAEASNSSRALAFLERELQIWTSDAPSLARHIVHLLSAVDVRSDAAVQLLEPLVGDTAAQHLAHELYTFLRSLRGLEEWDELVQYDEVAGEPVREVARKRRSLSRGRSMSRSSSYSRSLSRSSSRSRSPMRGDSYRPPARRNDKRWDQADSWVDPEFAAELRQRRRGALDRRDQGRQKGSKRPADSERGKELFDGDGVPASLGAGAPVGDGASAGLVIRGAAERRASLLERLAKAKGEAREGNDGSTPAGEVEREVGNGTFPQNGQLNRAQELRNRLLAEKKRKVLREQLMARKRAREAAVSEENKGEENQNAESKEAEADEAEAQAEIKIQDQ